MCDRKSQKKNKTKIILSILLVCFILVIYIDYSLKNKEEDTWKALDINSTLVQDLYNLVNPSSDATVLKGLYKNEKMSNDYVLAIGIYSKSRGI